MSGRLPTEPPDFEVVFRKIGGALQPDGIDRMN